MLIAREKVKSNIAEYILYMWQIEDIIRSLEFSPDRIKTEIVDRFAQPARIKNEIMQWYLSLMKMMRDEDIMYSGHLLFLVHKVNEMNDFHRLLLISPKQKKYQEVYNTAKPNIIALAERGSAVERNEIDTCLTGLYGLLLLNLQHKPISEETRDSLATVSKLIALLAGYYRKYDEGELDLEEL
jgi:Domain of unknown function (DUF4924)